MSRKKRSNLKFVRVRHNKCRPKGSPKKSSDTSILINEIIFEDGVFCLSHNEQDKEKEYCLFLINNTFTPPIEEATNFIDNQCYEKKEPCHWLNSLERLILSISIFPSLREYKKRRISLRMLITERKNLWASLINGTGPVVVFDPALVAEKRIKFNIEILRKKLERMSTHKKKIRFLRKRQAEYLLEVENFKNARFVRWVDMELEILSEPQVYPDKHLWIKLKPLDLLLIDLVIACSTFGPARHKDENRHEKLVFDEFSDFFIECTSSFFCMADGSLISKRIFRKYVDIYLKKEKANRSLN